MALSHSAQSGQHRHVERGADQHCARNVAQSGDALALLHSLPDDCTPLVFFDPQFRQALDKLAYGNEGQGRQRERHLLPAMSTNFIDACCREIGRVLAPSGYLMRWLDTFQLVQAHHLRITDLEPVSLIAWDNQHLGMGYRARHVNKFGRPTEPIVLLRGSQP